MSQLAIGMIETVGLAAGIEAADVCLKSANVTLIGYELTKGNGMTVVKIEGNVGAVKAAIEAATVAANKVSKVFSTKVIPRPSEGIDFLMRNCDTVGYESEKAVEELVEIYEDSDEDKNKENIEEDKDNTQEKIEVEVSEEISEHQINIEELEIEEDDSKLEETDNIEGNNQELSQIDNSEDESKDGHNLMHDIIDKFKKKSTTEVEYTCNLCKDPKCPRQKGDLKTTCIHYEDQNK
ncbi:MAG: BMC domain-containing protein [Peptostreptococcaceae bacterium]|nr:BMC domain-containing protein [Peptostreptococcaceae bacterium]MDU4934231.1 BMC domain-containing protein [Peptostreptococcaceae bacterium]